MLRVELFLNVNTYDVQMNVVKIVLCTFFVFKWQKPVSFICWRLLPEIPRKSCRSLLPLSSSNFCFCIVNALWRAEFWTRAILKIITLHLQFILKSILNMFVFQCIYNRIQFNQMNGKFFTLSVFWFIIQAVNCYWQWAIQLTLNEAVTHREWRDRLIQVP